MAIRRARRHHASALALGVALLLTAGLPEAATRAREAGWQQAHALYRQGRYERALHAADPVARRQGGRTPAGRASVLIAARAEMAMGLLPRARQRLEEASAAAPDNLPLRAELARAAHAMGDLATVHLILQAATRLWQQPRTDRQNPANLGAMATVAQLGANWKWSNELFRQAVARAPEAPEPNVGWGQLFLEKHAAKEAADSFAAALKADPKHPDALVGLARTQLEKGYDRRAAERLLSEALGQNPRHAGALALQAEIALDGEDFERVHALIERLREVNPSDPHAGWLSASLGKLSGEGQRYQEERDARMRVRPGDGAFFVGVAEALVRQRRYRDARAVSEECLMHVPRHARCHNVLGTTLLRLGDEREGLLHLKEAFAADPYDVRTYNQLQLFDKTIPRDYTMVETEHLRVRLPKSEVAALERIVGPHLDKVFRRYRDRYGHVPSKKVTLELFARPEDFAVRTVGVPALDVSAVCFGPVITSTSPTKGNMNWGVVLSHELAHVFSLGLSRERVPRWLTEGLAEWETGQLHGEWRRRDGLAVWAALERGALPPIGEMSRAFFEANSNEDAVVAYLYSAHAVEFLIERFGFEALKRMLGRFAQGARERDVLEAETGLALGELSEEFTHHLHARYAGFGAQFLPVAEAGEPTSSAALSWARQAVRALEGGDEPAAQRWVDKAEAALGGEPAGPNQDRAWATAAFARASLGERRGEAARSTLKAFEAILARGLDGYEVRLKAGFAALRAEQFERAKRHLELAVSLAPDEMEAWAHLAEAHERLGDGKSALAARVRAFLLDAQNGRLGKALLTEAMRLQALDQVVDLAPWVIFVDPDDPEVHAAFGRALRAMGRLREAETALRNALAFGHPTPAPLEAELASLRRPAESDRRGDLVAPRPTQPLRGPAPPLPQSP